MRNLIETTDFIYLEVEKLNRLMIRIESDLALYQESPEPEHKAYFLESAIEHFNQIKAGKITVKETKNAVKEIKGGE